MVGIQHPLGVLLRQSGSGFDSAQPDETSLDWIALHIHKWSSAEKSGSRSCSDATDCHVVPRAGGAGTPRNDLRGSLKLETESGNCAGVLEDGELGVGGGKLQEVS
jgi:hypothetical protein